MPLKNNRISRANLDRNDQRRSLVEAIAKKAFWSYQNIAPSKVPDGKLIEKVLIHGSDEQRKQLFALFPADKIKRVWERRIIIQEPRLHELNRKIASSFFHISDPDDHIRRSYQKYNLYDRFSAKNA
jgi:hypothetical protein